MRVRRLANEARKNDFSLEKYLPQLEVLREQIQREGSLTVHGHYFFIVARKP